MARIAMDESNAPELRGRMFAELAQHVSPKRKAVEHLGEGAGEFTVKWMNTELRNLSTPELVSRLLQEIANGKVPADEVPRVMDALRDQIARH